MSSRIARAVLILIAMAAHAAPPLTTIQDVLYKADGTRFNGIIVVSWSSFDASDASNITSQTVTVKVTDGNLRVQLVPTTTSTPATYYLAKYNSDGRVQFEETWAVPSSFTPLRVRDVRVASGSGAVTGNDSASPTVQEGDVVGLSADLAARPLKGPGYAPGRAVYVNSQGALESVSGNSSDCVHVDGTSGACGSGGNGVDTAFVDTETPAGIVDGSNRTFLLSTAPNPVDSLMLYRNGILLKAVQDYAISVQVVTFVNEMTPQPGDTLLASYRTSETGTPLVYPSVKVLCSGGGSSATIATMTSLGTCTIPSGLLSPGNRVELRFDLEHLGTGSGFYFEVHWGQTTLFGRTGAAGDIYVSGRADAALSSGLAQVSSTSWGNLMSFSATAGKALDAYSSGITVELVGRLSVAGGDTLTLRNFTVSRLP